MFLQQGFDRTTLADIVECAGGSLATVYKLFGSKTGLLEAVMEARAGAKDTRLQDLLESGDPPAQVLERLGRDLMRRYLDPGEVALSRAVIAYSLANPGFAQRFYRLTLARARGNLARLFGHWQDAGYRLTARPDTLAAMFLGMFVYELHSQAISHGAAPALSDAEIGARLHVFCTGAGLC